MKRAVLGILVRGVIGLVMAAVAVAEQRGEVFAQQRAARPTPPPAATAGSELIVVPTSLGDKGQMLTVDRSAAAGAERVSHRPGDRQDRAEERPQHSVGPANDGLEQRESSPAGDSLVVGTEVRQARSLWPRSITTPQETAKILGVSVDEVKQMLDRRELHGYRDGADWKFKVEDIDQLAKQRQRRSRPPDGRRGRRRAAERSRAGPIRPGHLGHGDRHGRRRPRRRRQRHPLAGSDIKLGERVQDARPPSRKTTSTRRSRSSRSWT